MALSRANRFWAREHLEIVRKEFKANLPYLLSIQSITHVQDCHHVEFVDLRVDMLLGQMLKSLVRESVELAQFTNIQNLLQVHLLNLELIKIQVLNKLLIDFGSFQVFGNLKSALSFLCLEHTRVYKTTVVLRSSHEHKKVELVRLFSGVLVVKGEVSSDISVVVDLKHSLLEQLQLEFV